MSPLKYCLSLLALAALACSDSSAPRVPTTLDFEDRPNDGFTALTLPVTVASGVTFTEIRPSGTFYDFSTADGWGFVPCDATAHSGTMMIGFQGDVSDTVTGVITFNPPVARVDLFVGNKAGALVTVTAFNSHGVAVGSASRTSACPMLGSNDSLSVSALADVITKIEIQGQFPAIDDLTYYR